ncbi:hypothetical protein [Chondromyces crocatus]|uniref:Uncharacterized protein n=1 Tax=Chondromyces crocatus TaxID=52 RepID=A0A0K1EGU2_CHOCO|nr:hypothetical protein [Chondromyces crocatus]AKT40076.1 uncharacterized protein CMC5_042290 [Chondromyces crocatus]
METSTSDRDQPNRFNSPGVLAMFGGPFAALFGVAFVAASFLDPNTGVLAGILGALALVGGGLTFVWGRRETRRWFAEREARDAAVPAEERLSDRTRREILDVLAVALSGEVVPARHTGWLDGDEVRFAPEAQDHLRIERESLVLVVYHLAMPRRGNVADGGLGIAETGYWRVRALVDTTRTFDIVHRGPLGMTAFWAAQSAKTGDDGFDGSFIVAGQDCAWAAGQVTEATRKVLVADPTAILRGRAGRVEMLWPDGGTMPLTVTRFAQAAEVVSQLAGAVVEGG